MSRNAAQWHVWSFELPGIKPTWISTPTDSFALTRRSIVRCAMLNRHSSKGSSTNMKIIIQHGEKRIEAEMADDMISHMPSLFKEMAAAMVQEAIEQFQVEEIKQQT